MNINDKFERWLSDPESEQLEFKEASDRYSSDEALKYCVALANEGGGHLVLGVTDKLPRQITGTQAFSHNQLDELKIRANNELHIRLDVHELTCQNARVLVIEIPSHSTGKPLDFKGQYLMRAGGSLVPMTHDRLKALLTEDDESWLSKTETAEVEAVDVDYLLDSKAYFALLELPYPETLGEVLDRFEAEGLIRRQGARWGITNMAAMLLATNFEKFPSAIAQKAPWFIIYEGSDKSVTLDEMQGKIGYASGFENLTSYVHKRAPKNRFIEETLRREYKMFPLQAVRELIANALIHQDFSVSGASVMIEMYADRVEISSPGTPIIALDRFIDGYKCRNRQLASIMRRFGICEEKGSGIDKVIQSVEAALLRPPEFRSDAVRTTAILFPVMEFSDMSRPDRIRACYQHCCLCYVDNQPMTNASLRKRFDLTNEQMAVVSHVITQTKGANLIKNDANRKSSSPKHARYVPSWA